MIQARFQCMGLMVLVLFSGLTPKIVKSANDNCFSIVVGKNASANGQVLMAHNEDDWPPQIVNHSKVERKFFDETAVVTLTNGGQLPQVNATWSYLWSEMPGFLFSDSYLNEWGVCVCSDACPSREDSPELTDGGISYMLRRLVAERAKSAREGVKLAGELVEQFGYDGSGRTYIISDPDEGWLMAVVNGKHWLAARVPDDDVALIANTYTIHQVDFSDTLNFLSSGDIVSYAVSRGWYDPLTQGSFDFALAYADSSANVHPTNVGRIWSAVHNVEDSPPAYGEAVPFSVKPKQKLDAAAIMEVLRDHYEGTELYEANEKGNPHERSFRPVCRHDTQTSFVAELRRRVAPEVDLLYWCAIGSPCASVYIPFYFGMDDFPSGYRNTEQVPDLDYYNNMLSKPIGEDRLNAFWTFSRIRNRLESDYGELGSTLRKELHEIERGTFAAQSMIEMMAGQKYNSDESKVSKMLKDLSDGAYNAAVDAAVKVLESSPTPEKATNK